MPFYCPFSTHTALKLPRCISCLNWCKFYIENWIWDVFWEICIFVENIEYCSLLKLMKLKLKWCFLLCCLTERKMKRFWRMSVNLKRQHNKKFNTIVQHISKNISSIYIISKSVFACTTFISNCNTGLQQFMLYDVFTDMITLILSLKS